MVIPPRSRETKHTWKGVKGIGFGSSGKSHSFVLIARNNSSCIVVFMASVTSISAQAHWSSVPSEKSWSTSKWPRITNFPLTAQPTQVTSTSRGLVVVSDGLHSFKKMLVLVYLLPTPPTVTGRSMGYRVIRGGKLVSSEMVPLERKLKVSSSSSSSMSFEVV